MPILLKGIFELIYGSLHVARVGPSCSDWGNSGHGVDNAESTRVTGRDIASHASPRCLAI